MLRGELPPSPQSLLCVVVCAGAYGLVMGAFTGCSSTHWPQLIYSGVKLPLLLLATFFLSLPSFYVLNSLMGVRDDFPVVLRGLTAAQAGLSLVLLSLAPLTLFSYFSITSYSTAILLNGLMLAVASSSAQLLLRRTYRMLWVARPQHRTLLRIWLVVYSFVAIQLAWLLRPFIGDPSHPPEFLRSDAWGNAYVVVFNMLYRAISHLIFGK